MDQKLGYVTSADGTRICYSIAGQGPVLVKASNWLTHVEADWTSPVWRHWWEALTRDHTLVRFDQRGCGLSDWSVDDLSLDARVADLEAVVDHLGLERFDLLGISHGGPTAVEYTVRHPERVRRIVIHGAAPRGWHKRGLPSDEREAQKVLMREGWERENPAYKRVLALRLLPEATPEQMSWVEELHARSANALNAVRSADESDAIDVVDKLELVDKPVLVTHARGDACIPHREGELIAALIPGARLVTLESNNHLLMETDPAWKTLVREVRAFLSDESPAEVHDAMEPASRFRLTAREAEVLRMVADGLSDREIADRLIVSTRTINQHVASVLQKTGSANRAEAAARAVRHGIA